MSSVKSYIFTDAELTGLVNRTKEVLIGFLANEGLLDVEGQEEYEEFCASYAVVIVRRGMFGHFWDKVRGLDSPDGLIITVMHSKLPTKGKNAPVIQLVQPEE